jgi:hypothetical protein
MQSLFSATVELVERGKDMDVLRHSKQPSHLRECGERMRSNLAVYDVLDQRALAVPPAAAGRSELYMALSSARPCLTCQQNAARACIDATKQLNDIRSLFRPETK